MKKILFFLFLVIVATSCSNSKNTKVTFSIKGAEGKEFVIKIQDVNTLKTIDTLKALNGDRIVYKLKNIESPDFYYLYYGERKVASLIAKGGEKIKIEADTLGNVLSIEGSDESSLLLNQERELYKSITTLDSLSILYNDAVTNSNSEKAKDLNYKMGSLYVNLKRAAIKEIYSNPYSITNIRYLFYKFTPELPLFADNLDALIFKRVYDSLFIKYPSSRYLTSLGNEIKTRESAREINSKLSNAQEISLPKLELPDNKGKIRNLIDLKGKVVILLFWSVKDPEQLMFNNELLSLYSKLNPKGLEIFQVSIDTDKTAWGRTISDQKLPWINVCDALGGSSKAVISYNIKEVPTMFLIDRNGDIRYKDVFNISLLESKINSLL